MRAPIIYLILFMFFLIEKESSETITPRVPMMRVLTPTQAYMWRLSSEFYFTFVSPFFLNTMYVILSESHGTSRAALVISYCIS